MIDYTALSLDQAYLQKVIESLTAEDRRELRDIGVRDIGQVPRK